MFGSTARFGVPSGTSNPFGSPSIFGTTPSSGGGGASPVLFGGTSSTTFSFGSNSSTPVFGSGFGVPSGSSNPFGSPSIFGTSTGVFGTNSSTSSSGFNSSTPAFSSGFGLQPSTSTSFGSPSIFGQNNDNSTTPSIFGGNSTGVFGINSSPFASKTPASGSGFGALSGPFGSSSGFGQNSSTISSGPLVYGGTSSGAFGTNSSSFGSKSPFGAPSHTAFGSPIATSGAPLPPAFGVHSSNGSTSLGPSNFFNQPPGGSKAVVYAPTSVSIDGTNVKLQSISAMPAYKEKCHEELRWEDKGHVAPNPFAPGKSSGIQNPFDQKVTPNPFPNPFDQNATPNPFPNPFDQKATPNPFQNPLDQKATPDPFQNPFDQKATPNPFQNSFDQKATPNPFDQKATPSPFQTPESSQFQNPFAPKNKPNQFPVGSSQFQNPFAPKNTPNQFPVGSSQFQNPFAPKNTPNQFPVGSSQFQNPFAPKNTPNQFPVGSSQFQNPFAPTVPNSTSSLVTAPSTNLLKTIPNLFPPSGTTSVPTLTPSFPSSSSGFWSGASPTISTQSPSTQTAHTVGASGGILPNSSSGAGGVQQTAPVMMSPFGALPAMPKLSIGHSGSTPSIQYGISSLPVVDKTPARTRLSSPLISCHHLSQRRPRLPVRKYDPHSDRPKVPFYCNEEATAPLFPRDNPRALVINPAPSFLQRHTAEKTSPAPSSDSIEGEDVVDEEGVRDIEALMPKLRLADYYTEPTIQELATKEKAEPGFIRHVNDFVVGRHGYGSIKFLGETNVEKLELDSVVKFNYREVVVYEEGDEKKPGVGEGLNKAAEVRLLNIKCIGKKTGKQYVDGPRVIEYKQKLMKKANEQGAEFVSYDAVLGEWKFRVQHFSSCL